MTLAERVVQTPTVHLHDLLSGERPPVEGDTTLDVPAYTEEILRSGFPALRALPPRPGDPGSPPTPQRPRPPPHTTPFSTRQPPATRTNRRRRPRPPTTTYSTRSGYWTQYQAGYQHAICSPGLRRPPSITSPILHWQHACWVPPKISLLFGQSAGPAIARDGTLLGALSSL